MVGTEAGWSNGRDKEAVVMKIALKKDDTSGAAGKRLQAVASSSRQPALVLPVFPTKVIII